MYNGPDRDQLYNRIHGTNNLASRQSTFHCAIEQIIIMILHQGTTS